MTENTDTTPRDEEEQTQSNCYVGKKGNHLSQCGYST